MVEIPWFNYEGKPLLEKYRWMQQGKGPAAADPAARALSEIAGRARQSSETVGTALAAHGVEWHGSAATATAGALDQAGRHASRHGQASQVGGGTVARYGGSFAELKPKIAPPIEVGENSWWGRRADELGESLNDTFGNTFGVQSDFRKRLAENRIADEAANRALRAHEAQAREALTTFPAGSGGPGLTPNAGAGPGGGLGGGGGALGTGAGGVPSRGAGSGGDGVALGASGDTKATPWPGGAAPGDAGAAGGRGAGLGDSAAGGGPAATEDASWTPLDPGGAMNGGLPGGGRPIVPDGTGGFVPAPVAAGRAGYDTGTATPARPGDGRYAGGHSGGQSGLPARGGPGTAEPGGRGGSIAGGPGGGGPGTSGPGTSSPGTGGHGGGGGPGAGGRGPAGMGGMPPIMGAGAGAGGNDREHRNSVYLPSDEPFVVHFDNVCPAVIGLPDQGPEAWR